MTPKRFLAIMLICAGVIAWAYISYDREKKRRIYTPLLDDAIRNGMNYLKSDVAKEWRTNIGKYFGVPLEGVTDDMIKSAAITNIIELDGGKINNKTIKVPQFLLNEYKRKFVIKP